MFSFLQMFLLLIAFVHFTVSLLFVRRFVFALLLQVLWIWESVFTLHSFPTFGTTCFYQGFPGSELLTEVQKHRLDPPVCLNHTVFDNCMVSREIFFNLSKCVDKLLDKFYLRHFDTCYFINVILLMLFWCILFLLILFYQCYFDAHYLIDIDACYLNW